MKESKTSFSTTFCVALSFLSLLPEILGNMLSYQAVFVWPQNSTQKFIYLDQEQRKLLTGNKKHFLSFLKRLYLSK